jgi:hypothetical protein
MKKGFLKRKYEKRLLQRAVGVKENQDFLLARLKKEWEAVEKTIEKDKRKRRLYEIAQETGTALGFTILGMAAVCGILIVGAAAPNVFSAVPRFGRHRRYFNKNDFRRKVQYFRRRGYLKVIEDTDGAMELKLTELFNVLNLPLN